MSILIKMAEMPKLMLGYHDQTPFVCREQEAQTLGICRTIDCGRVELFTVSVFLVVLVFTLRRSPRVFRKLCFPCLHGSKPFSKSATLGNIVKKFSVVQSTFVI